MSSSPDHLYLDLSIINNDNLGNAPKTTLSFNESRNNPILENPSNYFLAIARFEVDTPAVSLPIFIPLLNVDGVNGDNVIGGGYNETAYTITMAKVSGNTMSNVSTLNVFWNAEDQTAPKPKNPESEGVYTSQDISTGYYNCYSTKWWLNCVNYTLLNVWKLVSNNADPLLAPFLTIDANTNLITLYTPNDPTYNFAVQDMYANGLQNYSIPIWTGGATTPPIQYNIFFNEPLFNLFSSFPSVYYGNSFGVPSVALSTFTDAPSQQLAINKPYLFNYYIQPINFNSLNKASITDSLNNVRTYTITTSEYSPVPMWNPIQSISFTSSLLPVVLSYDTLPTPFNSPSVNQEVSSGNNSLVTNMLSDIQVSLTSGSEYKPQVLYVPQNEYRFIDLNGTTPIHQASFSVYYKTKYNQQIPIRLGCQCGANLKILFRRKRFNLGNLPPYDSN